MKVKFDGQKYYALADYSGIWYPFWRQGDASILFGKLEIGTEISVDDKIAYLQNCGTGYTVNGRHGPYQSPCSSAYPNPNCGHCGGLGLGATINV